MSTRHPQLARKSTLTIEKLGKGVERARFDVLGTEYYMSRWMLADYLLLTKSGRQLPSEAYLITAKSIGNGHQWQNSSLCPAGPFTYKGFLVAIKMKLDNCAEKEEYPPGTRIDFSVGILYGPSICNWHCWRYVQTWWSPEVWEEIGFDYRKFQRNSSGPQPLMETMEFKDPINLNEISDADVQILCDFIQVGLGGGPALERSLRDRARSTSETKLSRAHAKARSKGFSKISDINSRLPGRLKRMLAINMLNNYWETNDPFAKTRARHIKQLGLGGPSTSGMASDLAEAGCIPFSRSVLLTKLGQICKQATRFFENHPEEFARLEERYIENYLHRSRNGFKPIYTGHSVSLPADARRCRKRSSKTS